MAMGLRFQRAMSHELEARFEECWQAPEAAG